MESETSETDFYADSLTTSAQVGIDGVAEVGVSNSTTWGKELTHGVAYTNSKQVAANYGYLATPVWYPVDATITGDFTATLGGVTYTLNDVTLTRSGATDGIINGAPAGRSIATVQQVGMSPQEFSTFCGSATPPASLGY